MRKQVEKPRTVCMWSKPEFQRFVVEAKKSHTVSKVGLTYEMVNSTGELDMRALPGTKNYLVLINSTALEFIAVGLANR